MNDEPDGRDEHDDDGGGGGGPARGRDETRSEARDPDARWPSEADPARGGITTSSSHTVPTVTPPEPGSQPSAGGHPRSAAATGRADDRGTTEEAGADDEESDGGPSGSEAGDER